MAHQRREHGVPDGGIMCVQPIQFHPTRPVSGARKLMAAVLEYALHDLQKGSPSMRRDALRWMQAEEPGWPYSFHGICEALGFDAGRLLAGAMARYGLTRDGDQRWTPQIHSQPRTRALASC